MRPLAEINLQDFTARYFYGTKAWIASRLLGTPIAKAIRFHAAFRDLARFYALAEIGCMAEFLDLSSVREDLRLKWFADLRSRQLVAVIRTCDMHLAFVLAKRLQILIDGHLNEGLSVHWPFEKWGDPVAHTMKPDLALTLRLAQYQQYSPDVETQDSLGVSRFFSFLEINSFLEARDASILVEMLSRQEGDLLQRMESSVSFAVALANRPALLSRIDRALGALPQVFAFCREMDALLQGSADNAPLQVAFWSYNAALFRQMESGVNSLILALERWPIPAETDALESSTIQRDLAETKKLVQRLAEGNYGGVNSWRVVADRSFTGEGIGEGV